MNKAYLARTIRATVGVNKWLQEDQCWRQRQRQRRAELAPRCAMDEELAQRSRDDESSADIAAAAVRAVSMRSERQRWAAQKLQAKLASVAAVGQKRGRDEGSLSDGDDSGSSSDSGERGAKRQRKQARKAAKQEKKAAKKAKKKAKKERKTAKKAKNASRKLG